MGDEYRDAWLSTQQVKKFHFLDPPMSEIHIEDIAHALSMVCRFGGHGSKFYSVAEHSIRMVGMLEAKGANVQTRLAALLHDAEEAYLPDIPRPIKHRMPEAQAIYKNLSRAILKKFKVDESQVDWKAIKELDDRICLTEAKYLGLWHEEWADLGEPLGIYTEIGWTPESAERVFLQAFAEIMKEIKSG